MHFPGAPTKLLPALAVVLSCQGDPPRSSHRAPREQQDPLFFSISPVGDGDLARIVPLGNLNPPGHVFPTDHIYLYLRVEEGADRPVETPVFAPGTLRLTSVTASEHVRAQILDYALTLTPCHDVTVVLGHVSRLTASLLGEAPFLGGATPAEAGHGEWQFRGEYSTGGETYRTWIMPCDIVVEAGQPLGIAGGHPGQWALDFGVYDRRRAATQAANASRWHNSSYLYAACPLDYYTPGPVRDRLWSLVDREPHSTSPHPCGAILQDVPGTAQGCWFREGIAATYPEDPHLALVESNMRPSRAVFSVGTAVATIPCGVYEFLPDTAGTFNRPFAEVTPGGTVHTYKPAGLSGCIFLHMPDTTTLWLEAVPEDAARTRSFSCKRTVFVR
ncbi:MAG: hypothetical protein AB1486_03290 [Planctomycetota bacterium]